MTEANDAKRDRLIRLKKEYERLSMEGLALIDACKFEEIKEVAERRREINKRIEELKECLK